MPIKLEIVAETPQDFATQLVGALAVMSGPKFAPKPAPIGPTEVGPSEPVVTNTPRAGESEKQTAARKNRKSPAAKTGGDMPDEKPEEVAQITAPAATQADVKTALIALLEAKGDDAPPALLKEFGAAKISELKPDVYAKVIARAEEMKAADK